MPSWAVAVTVTAVIGGVVVLLCAALLARRYWLRHHEALLRRTLNAAKRRPPSGEEVTLVLTDVQDSTELMEWDADVTTDAIALHDRLLRSYMTHFYGHEVSTEGDAFLVAFHEPFDAAAWCLSVQLALLCEFVVFGGCCWRQRRAAAA